MAGIFGVSRSTYSPPKKIFTDPNDWGGSGPDVFASLAQSLTAARASDPTAWTRITVPQKDSPGATKTIPYGSQRAFKRTVTEPAANAPASVKAKPFDAGAISNNAGRVAIFGQLGANDLQDTYKVSLNTAGKLKLYAPNPDYNSTVPGSKISLGDAQVELFDSKGKLIATTDMRNSVGFSNWINMSTETTGMTDKEKAPFAGLQLARGDYTVKITRENPTSFVKLTVDSKGQLDFTGTVLDDTAKVGTSLTPNAGAVTVTNSEGVKYSASFQLVKKSEGGAAPPPDPKNPNAPPPPAGTGFKGGPDVWEVQLISLKPLNKNDPTAEPPPSAAAPVVVGSFTLGGLDALGKVAPPEFTPTGNKVTFADVEVIPGVDGAPSTRKVTVAPGEFSIALKDPNAILNAPPPKDVTILNPGNIKVSSDGAHNVLDATPVNYSLYAVMGDPGATTFYTVKTKPLTPAEQKKADQEAAVAAAKKSAKTGSSSSILSLFA